MAPNANLVVCPICSSKVPENNINEHIDNDCSQPGPSHQQSSTVASKSSEKDTKAATNLAPIFMKQSKAVSSTQSPNQPVAGPSTDRNYNTYHDITKKRKAGQEPSTPFKQTLQKRSKTGTSISGNKLSAAPLAERLRPQSLEEFVGQPHLTGSDSLLMTLSRQGSVGSMILWGPPGCGKTTLARLLAKASNAVFKELSATDSNIGDVRAVAEEAKNVLALTSRRTILFLDEVHRFNKAQQDIFLPFIEQGVIQLIGATTENPSFKLTGALLSRCRVFVLEPLKEEDIKKILTQAIIRTGGSSEDDDPHPHHEPSSPLQIPSSLPSSVLESPRSKLNSSQSTSITAIDEEDDHSQIPFSRYPQCTSKILSTITSLSGGDARTAISLLELVLNTPTDTHPDKLLELLRRSVSTSYDRTGESHYDMISALHKSVRGSNGSAALYWLARMLTAGEDPMFIARRMSVCASEDIGMADSKALPLAMATMQACQMIGMPECRINLAHLITYLSEAPKSTRAYEAYARAEEAAKANPTLPVPMMVRNAPTRLMKDLGYGTEYHYNPNYKHPVTNEYMPPELAGERFLYPDGDTTGKLWDEDALRNWEEKENGGQEWLGRGQIP
ncbi:hypothetical protein QCA50_004348 [Cerrena zonata]|uniref:UBZ4-type domain-containing protein n=1 Tax=Cerrena zonata TaxID=2478898 RepID=A0AAW0GHF8_9APHY